MNKAVATNQYEHIKGSTDSFAYIVLLPGVQLLSNF